jgi:hypothetical protein
VYLCARMNDAATQADLDCVFLRFGARQVAFGYVVDGSFTDFSGSVTSRDFYSGDEVQFFVGTDDDDREFVCKVNGVTVLSFTDSSDVSPLGELGVGFGGAGVPYGGIQKLCGSLDVWVASDRERGVRGDCFDSEAVGVDCLGVGGSGGDVGGVDSVVC